MRKILAAFIRWVRRFIRETLHVQDENLPYYVTIAVAIVLFVIGLNAFVELTDELVENELESFDRSVTAWVVSFRSDSLTPFFRFMTEMGDVIGYIVISVAIAAYFYLRHRSWRFIVQTLLVLLLSTVCNVVLKRFINRARPTAEHLVSVNTLSYPSGHSMSAMAFYGFLIYLCFQMTMHRVVRTLLVIGLVFMILSIGLSRIYLGVHFPSDVAAGYIGGFIWITFCVVIFNVIDLLRGRRAN
ncbi:phosphatase PAP2 family protein [Fulvivirgaceae bacterium PWU4]|uniref:Phosphatase PAP2 family protein n=1 Tax=Chryseosolibacter histidini TaxID=2782349 RepID=A0AAP2DHV0_9BACT|nr:phosphatase PAP2 family protein [Chryseosolibacter histidini]MBT1695668.1 phosphatase PAP2 family protein [Chryseosolibacter histidini]